MYIISDEEKVAGVLAEQRMFHLEQQFSLETCTPWGPRESNYEYKARGEQASFILLLMELLVL